jgi:hypothetical protein
MYRYSRADQQVKGVNVAKEGPSASIGNCAVESLANGVFLAQLTKCNVA